MIDRISFNSSMINTTRTFSDFDMYEYDGNFHVSITKDDRKGLEILRLNFTSTDTKISKIYEKNFFQKVGDFCATGASMYDNGK